MRHNEWIAVLGAHERQHFVEHVLFVLIVAGQPFARRAPFAVPTLRINTIEADKLNPALLNVMSERRHHTAIFVLEKTTLRCGENDDWRSSMAKEQQLHGAV